MEGLRGQTPARSSILCPSRLLRGNSPYSYFAGFNSLSRRKAVIVDSQLVFIKSPSISCPRASRCALMYVAMISTICQWVRCTAVKTFPTQCHALDRPLSSCDMRISVSESRRTKLPAPMLSNVLSEPIQFAVQSDSELHSRLRCRPHRPTRRFRSRNSRNALFIGSFVRSLCPNPRTLYMII
jgi:hypothetical protein